MQSQSGPNSQPPRNGGGRHSCLIALLVIAGVVILLGGGLAGLAYLVGSDGGPSFGQGIGVIELKGVITESESVIKTLVGFRRNKNVKVIILRIDSPGGGVAATQEIYREIERTKKRKKVIASLGNIAASGGLYIAASANTILANPATVTGSIGVIMQMINVEGLLGKIGFRPIVIKSGRYKDIGSATRTMTEDERAILQHTVDQLHQQFVRDLAKGRALDVEKVAKLADGRIFTGEEALSLGLVDELGNFEDAVNMAMKMAGLVGRVRLIYPKKKDIWWKDLLKGKSPLNVLPEWANQPLRFQYLYLPRL